MASTDSSSSPHNIVNVSRPVAKLLLHGTVLFDLFGELMDARSSIDRSSIASGHILVTQGDPKKVADIINKVVVEMDVLAMENDEEVLKVLNSLKKKFAGQIETDFDRSSSTFKTVFHRKVKNEIEPEIISLTTKTGCFSVSRQHMNYLQCHLDHIQEEVHTSWPDSAVSITVQKEARGQGSLLVSSKRFDFGSIKRFIDNLTTNVQKFSKVLEPPRALLLSGPRGQKEIRKLEREHNCRVSVLLPGHQVLVRAEYPGGHGLFLCEGNMAATECNVLVFPFNEPFKKWTSTQKRILQQGLLTTRTDMYAKFVGCSPKPCTLALKCPRPDDGRTVVLMYVPLSPVAEEVDKGLAEAFRLSCARGACIAVPVAMSLRHSLEENLKRIVCVVQEHFNEEENAKTIVLYLEKSSACVRQKLIEALEKTMSARWKTETDLTAVYEENCNSSSKLVIIGQTRDVETTYTKLQTVHVPRDVQERSSLLKTGMESGSDLSTVSIAVNSNSGAGNEAKNSSSTGLHHRKAAQIVLERSHLIANRGVQEKQNVPPYFQDVLLVTGIPQGTSADCLQNFLESVTDVAVDYVEMNEAEGKAIVFWEDGELDLNHVKELQQACQKNPLRGSSALNVQRIPLSHTVLVENLNPKTRDSAIVYFFSNKHRNNGGPVSSITRLNSTSALVHFESQGDAQAVVDKGSHVLDEFSLKVSLHLDLWVSVQLE